MAQFYETGQVAPQPISALTPHFPAFPEPTRVPPPLNYFTQRGQQLTTAGPVRPPQAPAGFFTRAQLPIETLVEEAVAPETSFSYFIPGQAGPAVPQAPGSTQLRQQIGELKGPTEPLKGTPLESLMAGLGEARWDQMAATGTNLFNVGAAVMGAQARSEKEERQAQDAYQRALQDFQLQKMQFESGLSQQDFENMMKVRQQTAAQQAQTMLKPTIKDGMLIYGQPKEGGQEVTVQKIAPTKEERRLEMLKQLSTLQTPDVQGAVLKGQVPGELAGILMPKIMQAQQLIMGEQGGTLAMMDDVTKRQYLGALVNMQLRSDPEIGPLVEKLIPELQQQQMIQSALK